MRRMVKGAEYCFRHEPAKRLVYLGRQGNWHQFRWPENTDPRFEPVWCELLDEDLRLIEALEGEQGG